MKGSGLSRLIRCCGLGGLRRRLHRAGAAGRQPPRAARGPVSAARRDPHEETQ